MSVCKRIPQSGELITERCPECGHATAVHVGAEECPVCRMEAVTELARTIGAATLDFWSRAVVPWAQAIDKTIRKHDSGG